MDERTVITIGREFGSFCQRKSMKFTVSYIITVENGTNICKSALQRGMTDVALRKSGSSSLSMRGQCQSF